jgi:hypothetical protein
MELVPYGNGKFYGTCRLPKHKEANGNSFLLDEASGRCSCVGKCQLLGIDMCELGAILWSVTNTQAADRIYAQRDKYGHKQWAHDRTKKRPLLDRAGRGG